LIAWPGLSFVKYISDEEELFFLSTDSGTNCLSIYNLSPLPCSSINDLVHLQTLNTNDEIEDEVHIRQLAELQYYKSIAWFSFYEDACSLSPATIEWICSWMVNYFNQKLMNSKFFCVAADIVNDCSSGEVQMYLKIEVTAIWAEGKPSSSPTLVDSSAPSLLPSKSPTTGPTTNVRTLASNNLIFKSFLT